MTEDQFPIKDEHNDPNFESIEEEYLSWKKNAPLLYDTLVSHLLEWPSMTCQYFAKSEENKTDSTLIQHFAIGTLTDEQSQNYLMTMSSKIPVLSSDSTGIKGFEGNLKTNYKCVRIEKKIEHPGEINKLRICPSAPNLIATKSGDGNLYVWDVDAINPQPTPLLTLTDNLTQGFALDWNCANGIKLLSGDNKGLICLYSLDQSFEVKAEHTNEQITTKPEGKQNAPALNIFDNNGMAINDCKFQRIHGSIFGAVSDDCSLTLWDVRSKNSTPFIRVVAHINEIFALDFSYHDEFLLLSGGGDNLVKLWDIRKFVRPVHEFESHTDKVLRVEWNPNNETLFASSGEDKTVNIWDCSRIGNDVANEDNLDGPPELLFCHKGHKGIVEDISWNPIRDLGLLSVDSENLLQIWEVDDKIYYDD